MKSINLLLIQDTNPMTESRYKQLMTLIESNLKKIEQAKLNSEESIDETLNDPLQREICSLQGLTCKKISKDSDIDDLPEEFDIETLTDWLSHQPEFKGRTILDVSTRKDGYSVTALSQEYQNSITMLQEKHSH
jgi:hypothetical protein